MSGNLISGARLKSTNASGDDVTGPRTIYLIKRVEAASKASLETALRDLDLTPAQYTTLSLLAPTADISSAELARRVLVTPQSMSEMIVALERKGLIERRENEANRRILHVALSAAGRGLLLQAEGRVDQLEAELFRDLDIQAHTDLRQALSTVLRGDRTG